jgi:hypothetical protein
MSSNKLKMYEKAYKKCIKECNMKSNDCKTKCRSPFLKLNLKLKSPKKSPKKSPAKKLNAYQKFVKKEYPKHKNLDRTEIFKVIAEKWNEKKH